MKRTEKEIFDDIIEKVFEYEGGYSFDKDDPGGETNYGISKRSNTDTCIKSLTKQQAKEIYFEKYWIPSRTIELPPEINLLYFDTCIHSGIKRAVKILQKSLNQFLKASCEDYCLLKEDGIIGFRTVKTSCFFNNYLQSMVFTVIRISFLKELIRNNSKLIKYWKGWHRRVIDVYTTVISKDKEIAESNFLKQVFKTSNL